jgi:hypothetical protein
MGFSTVYDYDGGKMDWLAFGLPVEGEAAGEPTIGALARPSPICGLDERLGAVAERLSEEDDGWCAVVSADGVVLGRLRARELRRAPADRLVREAMENGPSTYRPSVSAGELLETMGQGRFDRAFVTDSDGRLLGLVERAALESAVRG